MGGQNSRRFIRHAEAVGLFPFLCMASFVLNHTRCCASGNISMEWLWNDNVLFHPQSGNSTLWITPAFSGNVQSPAKSASLHRANSLIQPLRCPGIPDALECPACCSNGLILRGCPPVAWIGLLHLIARIDLFHSNVRLLPEQTCFPDKPALHGRSPVARMSCFTRLPTCCPNRSVSPDCVPVSQIGLFYTIARLFSGWPPRSLPACPHFG